jgi:hypothetical protein
MEILPNHKLESRQYEAYQLALTIFSTEAFKQWFLKTNFTELEGRAQYSNEQLYNRYLSSSVYRFSWKLVKRPWYKRFSSVVGWSEGGVLYTYTQRFNEMQASERAAHFAHEFMHIIGFSHSFNPSISRDNSLPYKVGDYVQAAIGLKLK